VRVLLSNDDGVGSPGIVALAAALGAQHEVWLVAPDRERSGCSHAITVGAPVVTRQVGPREFACSGLPVDCINMALAHVLPEPPDVVVSGINLGANLGTDVLYSGTAAAARQATLRGVPALAVSVAGSPPWHLEPAAAFVAGNLALLPGLCPPGSMRFVNVNFPNRAEGPEVVRQVPLARTRYTAEGEVFRSPSGEVYHFYLGRIEADADEGLTDYAAVHAGAASVTLVEALPGSGGGSSGVAWWLPRARG
jgi:5'-nucleotidase